MMASKIETHREELQGPQTERLSFLLLLLLYARAMNSTLCRSILLD